MNTCGWSEFAVCLNFEHDCMALSRQWYCDHNKMWWFVQDCKRRVEREEREFWRMLRKLNKDMEMEKEDRLLLVDTESL